MDSSKRCARCGCGRTCTPSQANCICTPSTFCELAGGCALDVFMWKPKVWLRAANDENADSAVVCLSLAP
eukprot:951308-Amphidinium_carterae.1